MVNLMQKKRQWGKNKTDATYLRNFTIAQLNWERNRQEDQFYFGRFDVAVLRDRKLGF